jgi:DNA-binding phage protein
MTTRRKRTRKSDAALTAPHRPHFLKWLRNPKNAVAYIEVVLEEGDPAHHAQTLRDLAEAFSSPSLRH